MIIFTVIGVAVTVRFFIKWRGVFMDRNLFFKQIRDIRGYDERISFQRGLDYIIENVTGREPKMNEEQSLEEDVTRIIKRIKAAKEDGELLEKAKDFIQKIKDELDK